MHCYNSYVFEGEPITNDVMKNRKITAYSIVMQESLNKNKVLPSLFHSF